MSYTNIDDIIYKEIESYLDNLEMVVNEDWPSVENTESYYSGQISGQKYTFLFIASLIVFNESDIIEIINDNYGLYFDEKINEHFYFSPIEIERNIYFERDGNNLNIYIEIFI
jgi:hypothetical protein